VGNLSNWDIFFFDLIFFKDLFFGGFTIKAGISEFVSFLVSLSGRPLDRFWEDISDESGLGTIQSCGALPMLVVQPLRLYFGREYSFRES